MEMHLDTRRYNMIKCQVSYYLGDIFYCYLIDAENEYDATLKLLNSIPKDAQKLFSRLIVERI